MGMLILTGILFVAFTILDVKYVNGSWSRNFGTISIMGIVLIAFMWLGLDEFSKKGNIELTSSKISEIEITALKDNTSNEGSFFLGTGSIEDEDYYYYMVDSDKGKSMKKVTTKNAYIKEIPKGETPNMTTYKLESASAFYRFLYTKNKFGKEYIFNVPEGTVTTEFKVDME